LGTGSHQFKNAAIIREMKAQLIVASAQDHAPVFFKLKHSA
jgi:hypothetical protein